MSDEFRTETVLPVSIPPLISDESWSAASSAWINNHIRNSPVSQAVEAWNHIGAALPLLRGYLENELRRASAPSQQQ